MMMIWAVKGKCSPGQEHMIHFAKDFIRELDKDKKTVILPSPVVTELLAPVPEGQERNDILVTLNLDFRIAAVDAKAAAISAKIWHDRKSDWEDVYTDGGVKLRNRFKFDTLILGCAVSNNVECFYTGDTKLANLASKYIKVENVFDIQRRSKPIQTHILGM